MDSPVHAWRWGELAGLVALTLLLLVVWRIPGLGFVVYPFRLFGTFIHELSHGLAALASGGHFDRFVVRTDLSGMAWSAGGTRWFVASAGYVGSAVFGGVLLVLGNLLLPARVLLFALGLALALLCVFFVRNLFGIGSGLALAAGLIVAGLWMRPLWAEVLLVVLALQAILDGFNSLFTVLQLSTSDARHTDAHTMSALSGLPPALWVALWSLFSLLVLLFSLRLAYHGAGEQASRSP